jgi:predicted RNase H-related nuclease YkuK (DUF458 family)
LKKFRSVDNGYVDPIQHTLDVLKKYPSTKVYIGTDSQNVGIQTVYVTVIAYRFGVRGVHYIYNKEKIPIIKDLFKRLFEECSRTIETAEWFTQQINVKVELDMDYNEDEYWPSNRLVSATRGWASSLGYKVNIKPHSQIATKAADYHCS